MESNFFSLDKTPDSAYDLFRFNSIDIHVEAVSELNPEGDELRDSDSGKGAVVEPGAVINGERVSTEWDEHPFQDALSASRGHGSPQRY